MLLVRFLSVSLASLFLLFFFFVMIRRPPRSTLDRSSAASDVYKRQHEEWIRAVLENRPDLTAVQLRRTRDLMDLHARDCLVEDFEELIPSLILPCLLYTSPSPRDRTRSRMPSSA